MTDQGFGAVRPLPGNGLVAHVGGLLLVCDAAEAVMEDLLGAVRETAASGGDGRALARRVAQVLAAMMGEPVACAVAGPVPEGVAVLVSGPASAEVTGSGGEVRLAGRDALTWSDRLVPGPVTRIELRLPDAGEASRLTRLDGGVVVGGGVRCDPSEAGEALPQPAAQSQSSPAVRPPAPVPPAPMPPAEPPVPAYAAEPPAPAAPQPSAPAQSGDWAPPPVELPGPADWSAPQAEAAPPAPPYPMGAMSPPAMPDQYVPPPAPPLEPQAPAAPAWDSGPMAAVPPPSAPGFGSQDDLAPARSNGTGDHPADLRNESFEYELLTPGGGPQTAPDLLPSAPPESEPESRPLVHGVDCKNNHFNDPRVPYCAVCGIALVQRTLVPYKGPRPPLGVLLLDDGMTLRLDADYLLGRDPERAPEVVDGSARPAKVTSPDGSVSRRHLRVALDGWDVNLIDLGSVNGTQIQPPGDPNFYDIPPNEPVTIMPGTTVRIGVSRTMRYESHRNH
ncbi:hypothetical protein GCM10010466_00930 [Planomonospora alba]|uniref:FHA domain-containing protein n=1 Tax=Planomonospora alba TaxID=161354 RepID=A0ABP6MH98_9ACTN